MCISDWSSDVCYSDLKAIVGFLRLCRKPIPADGRGVKLSELIGAAGATSLRQRLGTTSDDDGVARFLLDRPSGEQVAAIDLGRVSCRDRVLKAMSFLVVAASYKKK